MINQVLVDQAKITEAELTEAAAADLQDGQVRLKLESFAITTNNVTYAATGFVIGYWKFFSSGVDGKGIVPVWGVARVSESRCEAVPEGARLYGFYRMAEELIIAPEQSTAAVYVDTSSHRADLPLVYNTYVTVRGGSAEEDYKRALLQPLWRHPTCCSTGSWITTGSARNRSSSAAPRRRPGWACANSSPNRTAGLTGSSG